MNRNDIYRQMAERTQGNIYLGVVGPVRTGKSTFIKRFMELMVLPAMESGWVKERFSDEMPQSATGRTIMTTQVQFVPDEAVEVTLPPNTTCSMRLVDCVGYMIDGAIGHMEDGKPRLVKTSWYDEEVPFEIAAETGTRKVIKDYSTIGIVVTTDGTVAGIDRQNYMDAERKVINELKQLGKPFIVIVNSRHPGSPLCSKTVNYIQEEFDVAARAVDVLNMNEGDITEILGDALYEFPAQIMKFSVPNWLKTLPHQHWLWEVLFTLVRYGSEKFTRIRDYEKVVAAFLENEHIDNVYIDSVNPGEGGINASIMMPQSLFYGVLSEKCGMDIDNDEHLMRIMGDLAIAKQQYDYFKDALAEARETGYGVAQPRLHEMQLNEPQIVKRGRGYGVNLSATAPSWHIMRADVSAEISPMVGSEQQGEELVKYLLEGFENDPAGIWNTQIFGKSINDLMREGLNQKLNHMPHDARMKLKETVERVINESGGGLICILF